MMTMVQATQAAAGVAGLVIEIGGRVTGIHVEWVYDSTITPGGGYPDWRVLGVAAGHHIDIQPTLATPTAFVVDWQGEHEVDGGEALRALLVNGPTP